MSKVFEAINKVRDEVGYLKKEGKNKVQNYSYLGAEQLKEVIQKAATKHGLVWSTEVVYGHLHNVSTRQGAEMPCYGATVTLSFHHLEDAEGSIPGLMVQGIGSGADSGDKALMKAQTAAYREALKNAFCIPSGDQDPESDPELDDVGDSQSKPPSHAPEGKSAQTFKNIRDKAKSIKDATQLKIFVKVWKNELVSASQDEKVQISNILKVKCEEFGVPWDKIVQLLLSKEE